MFELHSCNFVYGFTVGVQFEEIEGDSYLIVSVGIFELIFSW